MSVSELRIESWTIPGTDLGAENPLPGLTGSPNVLSELTFDERVPPEDRRDFGRGWVRNCLPYRVQDGYVRVRTPRAFRVAVLENERWRAGFALDLGGRLLSLLHKPSQREMLDRNPVVQYANLAIRNAWFSGGVEWNVGVPGHCPFTCAPLFAGRAALPDGTPVLRMWEYERVRGVPFQIDAWLPDDLDALLVRVSIRNPHDRETPMYWWSNIAVPETESTRVFVPADSSFRFGYEAKGRQLHLADVPAKEGPDFTYPARMSRSADYFFRVRDGARPWICALEADGRGLVQTSTSRLKGRKLFLWGRHPGGDRWQDFLSVPGRRYIEIQAGLARTQAQCLPMPPRSEWNWVEAYGLMQLPPPAAHGPDWRTGGDLIAGALDTTIPAPRLEEELSRSASWADRPASETFSTASGWGALEERRRAAANLPPMCPPGLTFARESVGVDEAPWLELLVRGVFPTMNPADPPGAFMIQEEWRQLLSDGLKGKCSGNWAAWCHFGVMAHYDGDMDAAVGAWRRSMELNPNAWAERNLAQVAREGNRPDEAATLLLSAFGKASHVLPLAAECAAQLLAAGRPRDVLDLLAGLPADVRGSGRFRLIEGQARLNVGDLDGLEALLRDFPTVTDLREGERTITDLWFGLHEQRAARQSGVAVSEEIRQRVRREFPPPKELDFRMNT